MDLIALLINNVRNSGSGVCSENDSSFESDSNDGGSRFGEFGSLLLSEEVLVSDGVLCGVLVSVYLLLIS